jgi:hypothetical protein
MMDSIWIVIVSAGAIGVIPLGIVAWHIWPRLREPSVDEYNAARSAEHELAKREHQLACHNFPAAAARHRRLHPKRMPLCPPAPPAPPPLMRSGG